MGFCAEGQESAKQTRGGFGKGRRGARQMVGAAVLVDAADVRRDTQTLKGCEREVSPRGPLE